MSPRRSRRAMTALCAALALPAAALPGVAAADPKADSYNVPLVAGPVALDAYHLSGQDPMQKTYYNLDVSAVANWSGNISNLVGWNTSYLRQGATPAVSRMSLLQDGKLHVSWHVTGSVVKPNGTSDVATWIGKDAACQPRLAGANYDCTADTPAMNLFRATGVPNGPYVNLVLHAKFTVTPTGAVVTRSVQVVGWPAAPSTNLSLTPTLQLDYPKVPCGPVGNFVAYKLAPVHYRPHAAVTQQAELQEGLLDPTGLVENPAFYDATVGPVTKSNAVFDLYGSGHTTALGTLMANNVPPSIASVSPATATAGVPVTFSASVSSRCSVKSYVWKFSDGQLLSGATPQRWFGHAGTYGGQLTVMDASGMSSTRSFTVTVS